MSLDTYEPFRFQDLKDSSTNFNFYEDSLQAKKTNDGGQKDPTISGNLNSFTLDQLLEKIGFGSYHLKRFLTAGLVALMDGAVIMTFSMTVVMVKREWDYSDEMQSLIASIVFMSVVAGAYMSGPIADKFGRKIPMYSSLLFIIMLNLVSALSPSVLFYALTRGMLSFACGFYSPIGFTYVLEIMPPSMRGKVVTMGNAMLFLGQLFICFVGLLTLSSLDQGNWRLLTVWSTLPAIVSLILSFFFLDESPRYLLSKRRFNEAIDLLNLSASEAWKSDIKSLNEEHKANLRNWMEAQTNNEKIREEPKVSLLFDRRFRMITIILWSSWFVHSFIYYGIALFFPYMLSKITALEASHADFESSSSLSSQENNLGSLTLSVSLESFSVIIAFFVIDRKILGRKRAMIIFYSLVCFISLIAFLDRSRINFILWTTIIKIILNVCSFYNYLVTLEVYPTRYRATGVGAATAIGKAGTIIMPWICTMLLEVSVYGPFLGFAFMSAIACICVFHLPYDTSEVEMK